MRYQAVVLVMIFALLSYASAELTKEDVVQIIRAELEPIKLDIAEMKDEIKAIRAEMKAMATKDDIIDMQRSLYQAVIGMAVAIFVAILGAIFGGPMFAKWWKRWSRL